MTTGFTPLTGIRILRITLAVLMIIHSIARMYLGTVDDFGGFLNAKGFPFGEILAWGITLFELTGGIGLIIGYQIRIISVVFVIQLMMGIALVHWQNGWFVVGAGKNGVEYSVLLIVGFLIVGLANKK